MTSEAPESTSPITITETEPTVRSSASEPIITERTAESVQEQAVVEDLMNKQACRIETSFMAAMDRFSSELRTLFQERMPTSASVAPPGAGQRSQESERSEPYGEGSSHGTSARAPTSGYGQNFQPPTNGWGQSLPTWANSGPTRPSEMTYSPLHALAVTLGQSSPMNSTAQHGGPVHTLAVHTRPGPGNPPAASSQQYGQSNPIIPSLQTPLFPPDSHLHYGAPDVWAPYAHLGQTQGANMAPTGPTMTIETPIQPAQQQRPQNDGQQNQRPTTAWPRGGQKRRDTPSRTHQRLTGPHSPGTTDYQNSLYSLGTATPPLSNT
ncbi:unnamed protein product [Prunus brigantina]